MRVIALLLSLAVVIAASAKVPVADQLKATADLVRRLLPERVAAQFSFAPLRVDTTDGFDCFEVDGLQVRGAFFARTPHLVGRSPRGMTPPIDSRQQRSRRRVWMALLPAPCG